MPRTYRLPTLFTLLLLTGCAEKNSLGVLGDASSGGSITTSETAAPTGGTDSTSPGETSETSEAGDSAVTTSAATDSTDGGLIIIPDLGPRAMCDCAADQLCVQSKGVDSWYFVCAVPPAGCDPADLCTQACATACAVPPPLSNNCDEAEPPSHLDCHGGADGYTCSPWAENCLAGEKCVPRPPFDMRCEPIAENPAGLGEPCSAPSDDGGPDTCVQGAGCRDFDAALDSPVCVAHCTGTAADPVCPAGTGCLVEQWGMLAVCLATCDPLAQDCAAGHVCVPGLDGFVCLDQPPGVGGPALDTCNGLEACDPGLLCFDATQVPGCADNVSSCCTPYCDLQAPACDLPGTTCMPLFAEDEAPEGAENVGVCRAA